MFKNRIRCLGILLTRRCNLNCMYCYTDKGNDPSDILTLAEWKDVLTQARDMGCHWLSIAGSGEPMMDDRVKKSAGATAIGCIDLLFYYFTSIAFALALLPLLAKPE